MRDQRCWRRGLIVAAAVLAGAPTLARAQAAAPPPQPHAAPPAAKPSPFGLSPEALAQARRFADQVRAAAQAAGRQVAQQVPKALPAPPAAKPAVAAPPPALAAVAAGIAQPGGAPPPLRGPQGRPPQGPPPGGVDWRLAVADQRRGADAGPRAMDGLSLDPAAVNRTAVPILLLRGAFVDGARIYSFGDYYAISADMQGARISLTGTTALVKLPSSTPLTTSVEPEQLVVQRTVDGQLASFVRYGVLYTVELHCDAPTDPRCKTDAVVRDLVARNTVVAFGKAARQAAGMGG